MDNKDPEKILRQEPVLHGVLNKLSAEITKSVEIASSISEKFVHSQPGKLMKIPQEY